MNISLCIPTMQNWEFLRESLPRYIDNSLVDEIVITDEDGLDSVQINQAFQSPKLRIFLNSQRLGSLRNKLKCAALASNNCICLMDSDNFADELYFRAFLNYIDHNGGFRDDVVYAPLFGRPSFHFGQYIDHPVTLANVSEVIEKGDQVLLNTGNFIVSKKLMNLVLPKKPDPDKCYAMCSIYLNYQMMKQHGAQLQVVPGMEYEHRVHDKCYSAVTWSQSQEFLAELQEYMLGRKQ